MRQAGTLSDETSANRFVDYLLTVGISAKADPSGDGWAVWIYDEAHLARGKQELAEFQASPSDPKYAKAASEAATMRREVTRNARQAQKNIVDMRDRWNRPTGQIAVTILLIIACGFVYIATRQGEDKLGLASWLYFSETIDDDGVLKIPVDSLYNIKQGQVWRLVTPIFVHFGPVHIFFNMLWLYDLGGMIESRRGHWRMILLVLLIAVTSNLAQGLMKGDQTFGGMSGVVSGLFGYVWMKGRYDPGSGLHISPNTVIFMVGYLLFCTTGYLGPIANWAHGIGLATGVLIGIAPRTWRL